MKIRILWVLIGLGLSACNTEPANNTGNAGPQTRIHRNTQTELPRQNAAPAQDPSLIHPAYGYEQSAPLVRFKGAGIHKVRFSIQAGCYHGGYVMTLEGLATYNQGTQQWEGTAMAENDVVGNLAFQSKANGKALRIEWLGDPSGLEEGCNIPCFSEDCVLAN